MTREEVTNITHNVAADLMTSAEAPLSVESSCDSIETFSWKKPGEQLVEFGVPHGKIARHATSSSANSTHYRKDKASSTQPVTSTLARHSEVQTDLSTHRSSTPKNARTWSCHICNSPPVSLRMPYCVVCATLRGPYANLFDRRGAVILGAINPYQIYLLRVI